MAMIVLIAIPGLFKLTFDDSYYNLFKSDNPAFKRYETFSKDFNFDENDFILIASSEDVLSSNNLDVLYQFDQKMREMAFVESVFSIYSLISFADADYGEPMYSGLDANTALETFRSQLMLHPLANEVLVSNQRHGLIFIASLNQASIPVTKVEAYYTQLQALANEHASDSLKIGIAGIPALRMAVVRSAQFDVLVFQGMGLMFCLLLGIILFRNFSAVTVSNLAAVLGPLTVLGTMGHIGIALNAVNIIAPTLLLILCFADSVHMVTHIRDQLAAGKSAGDAVVIAFKEVGPACAMTAFTTIVAFSSLSIFSSTAAVQQFGWIGAAGMLMVLLTVTIFVPLLSLLLMKPIQKQADGSWNKLDQRSQSLILAMTQFAIKHASLIAISTLLIIVVSVKLGFNLPTNFRYSDHIPNKNEVYIALKNIEKTMGGAMPIRVFVDVPVDQPDDTKMLTPLAVEVLAKVHTVLAQNAQTHRAFSILNLLDSMPAALGFDDKIEELDLLPESALSRLLSDDYKRLVVTASVADHGSMVLEPLFTQIEQQLSSIGQQYPGYQISLNGLFVASSRVGHSVIPELANSLIFALIVIFIAITLSMRSIKLGLISIVPNILPTSLICALLHFSSIPLQYITVLAFTVCLGVSVDDTIHYLFRYRLLRQKDLDTIAAIKVCNQQIGRALITTTIVISAGMAVLLLSASMVTRQFGLISTTAVIIALFADLIILVALLSISKKHLARSSLA